MKQSQLFTKTLKTVGKDEQSINAQYLERGGFIYKNLAGVYSYLPLGLRVLNKIIGIIREEMNAIGGQEVVLNTLQDPEIWKKTKRWSDEEVDIWFKTRLKNDSEVGLSYTHEEPLTELMSHFVNSYKDLPAYVYQFQTKFRNELRAKSGIMRTREFIMKDLYSFSKNEREHLEFYKKAMFAYKNIFDRVGIGNVTYLTYSSGGVFSEFSHEFQTLTDAGEDVIYINKGDFNKGLEMEEGHAAINKRVMKVTAINKEIYKLDLANDLGFNKDFETRKATEVGNIFTLGTRFSEPLGLSFTNEAGKKEPVFMGSYGIGPGRLLGTIVETSHDDKGIIWPETVAPFKIHLVDLNKSGEKIYTALRKAGIEVLWDDRDASAGVKFADADLIGIPYRAVVSEKTGDQIEIKNRNESKAKLVSEKDLFKLVS